MIITKLYGGLGNQMYQYAAGLSLAKRLGTHHYLDTSWFEEIKGNPDITQRIYELNEFGIQPPRLSTRNRILLKLSPPKIFKEEFFVYDASFEQLKGNVVLDGYWQSYKYFEAFSSDVKKAFAFQPFSSKSNQTLRQQMLDCESVSLHVRRGDYNTKRGREFHGLIGPAYYKAALEHLTKKIKDPLIIFLFSDELEWCKKTLKFDYPVVYIDSNSANTGEEDMQLMSSCRHNIIANSSFSWWAAWLNGNKQKLIYAPASWFKGARHEIEDRIPHSWTIL